jgi:ferredoxin--NADP+ reductase
VATGTGIAPFYAMFRSGLSDNKLLIHGSRYLEQFYFFDEFSRQLGSRYIRCCSGEEDGQVYRGRVTGFLEEVAFLDPGVKYYLCGSAEMVVETRDVLIKRGIPFHRIMSEIYF